MSKIRAWSSKYVNYVDGGSNWIRADHVERMREHLIAVGWTETGATLVTGGKTYHEFTQEG